MSELQPGRFRSVDRVGRRRRRGVRAGRCFETLERRWVCYAPVAAEAAGEASPTAMPDFDLVDVNPASPRYQQAVSPRDYLEQVSGWYFGHAT